MVLHGRKYQETILHYYSHRYGRVSTESEKTITITLKNKILFGRVSSLTNEKKNNEQPINLPQSFNC